MKTSFWSLGIALIAVLCFGQDTQQSKQNPRDIYNAISDKPSKTRWCLSSAGDDPAAIISGVCRVYAECLRSPGLDATVDQIPYPTLSEAQVTALKKCHQAVYNGARVNPQVKGSKATQEWLMHGVYHGTEVKAFDVPSFMNDPH